MYITEARYLGATCRPEFRTEWFSGGTIQARKLLAAYKRYDKLQWQEILYWPVQRFFQLRWRNIQAELLETRSNILYWGGRL